MAERKKITLAAVRGLTPGQEIWDAGAGAVSGFGARRQQSDAVSYVVLYRTDEGRARRFTIGRHGAPWTPEEARDEAKRILGEVARGNDPAGDKRDKRIAKSVSDLCDAYLDDAENGRLLTRRGASKKPSTLATDRGRIDRHIRPLLGSRKVAAVTSNDIEAFMHGVAAGKTARREKTAKPRGVSHVRGGKGTASRTVGLLGAIFTYAVRKGYRPDNPVRGIVRYADGQRQRRLVDKEYAMLGRALCGAATVTPGEDGKPDRAPIWRDAVAAARFLAITGWRSGEVLGLRWNMIDIALRTAHLPDTKSGASMRPLAAAACDILQELGIGTGDRLVFRASHGEGMMTGFPRMFARIRKLGKLPPDITPHVLLHSFASLASDIGYSEPTIAAMVGHKGQSITGRYIHSADHVLLDAADKVAAETMKRMGADCEAG